MTQLNNLIGDTYYIAVPEDASSLEIEGNELLYMTGKDYGRTRAFDRVYLPSGNWSIIATSKDITEEQAAGIVQRWAANVVSYRNYMWPKEGGDFYFNPKDSLRSLLKSKGIEGNAVLIKKV